MADDPARSADDVRPPGRATSWVVFARELLLELMLHCKDPFHAEQLAQLDALLNDGRDDDR